MFRDAAQPRRRHLPGVGFLALAITFHLGMLLLPGQRLERAPTCWTPVEVRLVDGVRRAAAPAAVKPDAKEAPRSKEQPQQRDEKAVRVITDQQAQPEDLEPEAKAGTEAETEATIPRARISPNQDPRPVTARRIRESLESFDWAAPDSESRNLGRTLEGDLGDDWWRPVLSVEAGPLADAYVTGETEIVDRWLEPGGVHRVVFRGSDGRTYCGRQEPVNDFRPWEQMPMMIHRCAGGGKRR